MMMEGIDHTTSWTAQITCMKWKISALFIIWLLLTPQPSSGARPLVTDDADTAGKGKAQIELGVEIFTWQDRERGIKTRETGTEISSTFTYGVADHLDLVVGIPYVWGAMEKNGQTTFDADRLSDISLEVKWRFYENKVFQVAFKPGLTLPTGNHRKEFGTGRPTYGLVFIASKEMGDMGFHFNTCYTRNENKVDKRVNLWSASVAATYEAIKGLNLVGNVGLKHNTDPAIKTAPAFWLAGFNYSFNDYFTIDGALKFRLNRQEADRAMIAGITIRF